MTPNNKKNLLLVGAAIAIWYLWNKKKKDCEESGGGGGGGSSTGESTGMPSPNSPTFPLTVLPNTPTQTNISVTTCPAGQIAENGKCVDAPPGTPECSANQTLVDGVCKDVITDISQCKGTCDCALGTPYWTIVDGECICNCEAPKELTCDKGQKVENGVCVAMTCEDKGQVTYNGGCISQEEYCTKIQGGTWDGNTCTPTPTPTPTPTTAQEKCTNIGGIWDAATQICMGAKQKECTIAGGTWDATTQTCTPKSVATAPQSQPVVAENVSVAKGFADSKHPFFAMPKSKKQNFNIKKDFFDIKQGF
jgi:hypothetical protein